MLVLARTLNEEIHIGGGIVIKILALERSRVKIGIEAPGLRILRGELSEREQDAKRQ